MGFWFDEVKRLETAKRFQISGIKFIQKVWTKDRELKLEGFNIDELEKDFSLALKNIETAYSVGKLLQLEADLTKKLYKYAAKKTNQLGFIREHSKAINANGFLDHGNYLAYGLGATTLWVLGIPHGFAVMHGKTRRGALVFDVADLIKDAIILPLALSVLKRNRVKKSFALKFYKHLWIIKL